MKVKLGHHLEDYLHQHHHNVISLELTMENTKHVGEKFTTKARNPEPRLVFSQPMDQTGFDRYTVDDITIYVAQNIKAKNDELIIMDQVVDGMDTCHVEGWIGNPD